MVDFVGDDSDNVFDGTVGADTAYGRGGRDRLSGLGGNDVLYGEAGNDQLYGGDGDDSLFGGAGADIIDGGAGRDSVEYVDSSAGVLLDLANGTGTGGDADGDVLVSIEEVWGSSFADTIVAGASGSAILGWSGDDVLVGGAGNDVLGGDYGNDRLVGSAGADNMTGWDDVDWADYSGSPAAIQIRLLNPDELEWVSVNGEGGDAEGDFVLVECISGSEFGDVLTGNDQDNTLLGNGGDDRLIGGHQTNIDDPVPTGNDTLDGGAGDDWLRGDEGHDTLIGGDGADWADYSVSWLDGVYVEEFPRSVSVNLPTGIGFDGDGGTDTLTGIENILGTPAGNDRLIGNATANVLQGSGGSDTLSGGAGADTLDGGSGADLVTYSDSTKGVTVNLATGTGSSGTAYGDTLISIEAVEGSAYGDTLIGGAAANALRGGDGGDLLQGGLGADTLDGGAGVDAASYSDSAAAVIVDLGAGTGSGGSAAGDILVSIEAVNGSAHADRLIGSAAANTLTGAGGRDVLTGGAGTDRFVFAAGHSAPGANADRITDFNHTQGDRIDLSRFDADGSGDGAFTFIGTAAYAGVAGQLRYALSGTDAVIGGDTDGDGVSDFEIVLSNVGSLQAADFVL